MNPWNRGKLIESDVEILEFRRGLSSALVVLDGQKMMTDFSLLQVVVRLWLK